MIFFKLLWYKFFRFLEKNAVIPDFLDAYLMKKRNAFYGMLFSSIFLLFNSMIVYFKIAQMLDFHLGDSLGVFIMLIYWGILSIIGYMIIMRKDNYIEIEKEINILKYRGNYGNVIIAIYIILTLVYFSFLVKTKAF